MSKNKHIQISKLMADTNIGCINAHGSLISNYYCIVPDNITLWVTVGAGSQGGEDGLLLPGDKKFLRKYGPGSLIQEHNLDFKMIFNQKGTSIPYNYCVGGLLTNLNKELLESVNNMSETSGCGFIHELSPFISAFEHPYTLEDFPDVMDEEQRKYFSEEEYEEMKQENIIDFQKQEELFKQHGGKTKTREFILNKLFGTNELPYNHDNRIIDRNDILDDKCSPITFKLSEILKLIEIAKYKYPGLPDNWVGVFCRSGDVFDLNHLSNCGEYMRNMGAKIFDYDLPKNYLQSMGLVTYGEDSKGKQLKRDGSLATSRLTQNFKSIVENTYNILISQTNPKEPILTDPRIEAFKQFIIPMKKYMVNRESIPDIFICGTLLIYSKIDHKLRSKSKGLLKKKKRKLSKKLTKIKSRKKKSKTKKKSRKRKQKLK